MFMTTVMLPLLAGSMMFVFFQILEDQSCLVMFDEGSSALERILITCLRILLSTCSDGSR